MLVKCFMLHFKTDPLPVEVCVPVSEMGMYSPSGGLSVCAASSKLIVMKP